MPYRYLKTASILQYNRMEFLQVYSTVQHIDHFCGTAHKNISFLQEVLFIDCRALYKEYILTQLMSNIYLFKKKTKFIKLKNFIDSPINSNEMAHISTILHKFYEYMNGNVP